MVHSQRTETDHDQYRHQKESAVPCRNIHIGPRQGQGLGPIVSYCPNGSFTLHGTRTGTRMEMMDFCIMLCTVHTTQGQTQGTGPGTNGFQTHFTTGSGTRQK